MIELHYLYQSKPKV